MDVTEADATQDHPTQDHPSQDRAAGATPRSAPLFVFSGGPEPTGHCGDKRCADGNCRDQTGRKRCAEADVRDCDLSGSDLSGAILAKLDFGTADLRHTRLADADLSDSDLHAVKNLLPEQLGGANLHGAFLPDGMDDFEAVARVQDLSVNAGKLLVTLLAACAFMLLTIARLTDPQILTDSATAKLPVVDAEISVKLFFVFGPAVILGMYFAFHLYLQRLWETLAGLPAIFPDGVTLDRKTYPWLVNDLVRLHSRFLNRRCLRSPLMYFQEKLWGFVAYWLPPLLLLPFWARYLCCRDWWVTGIHLGTLAVAAWSAAMFSYLARITLERDRPRIRQWQNDWLRHNGRPLAAWALATGLMFAVLSASAFYGLPPEATPAGRSPLAARLAQAVPWALDLCHTPAFARFEDMGQVGGPVEVGATPLAGARLRNADLRYARAQGAALPGADLRRANLQFADLRDTDLTDANLEGARLEQARLDYTTHKNARNWFLAYYDPGQCQRLGLPAGHDARMDRRLNGGRTDLSGYNLSGASLRRASLREAVLQRACLQYTDLTDADLQMADLTGGSLRGADLTGAHLYLAHLDDVDVQGAHFDKAILTGDTGATNSSLQHSRNWLLAHYNAQQLIDLTLPGDHEDRLKTGDFGGYQLEGLDLHGSRFLGLRFARATFYQSNLSQSDLRAAVLQNTVFYGADLTGTTLRDADLTGANLQSARLEGADLTNAVLTGASLAGAEYDPNTKWPTPDFAAHHPEMIIKPVSPAGIGAASRWPRLSIIQDAN